MLKKPRKLTQRIVKRLQMAPEAAGCLRITLIDNTHAFVENHQGCWNILHGACASARRK